MSTQENLEERIERIRKRNEELQKRHAEAEADKQRAKKENAMVQTKLMSYDDWPKEHKYDKVDFTFDKNEDEHITNDLPNDKKTERLRKSQFAEGDGPPPDPTYSFLKDADRDFNRSEQAKNKNNPNEKAQWTNQRDMPSQQRGRGGHNRGNFRGNNRGKSTRGGDSSHHRNDSHPEYDAWRSERNRIDEARINRQRNAEGKWRREWDVEKINNDGPKEINHTHKPERLTVGDVLLSGARKASAPEPIFDKTKDVNRNRPNIMVSLNRTGEVQSVKVTSPPAIGSGRVGPRLMKSRPLFPEESFKDKKDEFFDGHKSRGHMDGRQNQKNEESRSPKKNEMHQQSGGVQNRLNKYKQANDFSQLSKELKDVSAEIEGIYSTVDNLNKKHGESPNNCERNILENFENNLDVGLLIKNHTNATSDEFSLSTDLVLESNDVYDFDHEKSEEDVVFKCNFGDMKTNDIENYIEREVQKNNTCLSPDIEEIADNNCTHEIMEENKDTNEIQNETDTNTENNELELKTLESDISLENNENAQFKENVAITEFEAKLVEEIEANIIEVKNTTIDHKIEIIDSKNGTVDADKNIEIESKVDQNIQLETKESESQQKSIDDEISVKNKDVEIIGGRVAECIDNVIEVEDKLIAGDAINIANNDIVNEIQCQEKFENDFMASPNLSNENKEDTVISTDEKINTEKSKTQIELNNEAIMAENVEKQA